MPMFHKVVDNKLLNSKRLTTKRHLNKTKDINSLNNLNKHLMVVDSEDSNAT